MNYVDGFLFAVPADNRQAFLDTATRADPVFRDHGAILPKVMADPRMQPENDASPPFDGRRMIFGGFVPVLDI